MWGWPREPLCIGAWSGLGVCRARTQGNWWKMIRDVWGKLGKYGCREAFRTSFHNYLCLCLSPLPRWLEVRDGLLYTIVSSPSSPFPALEKPLINMFEWMKVCVFSTGLSTKSEQSLCTVSLSPGSHGSADCGPPEHLCVLCLGFTPLTACVWTEIIVQLKLHVSLRRLSQHPGVFQVQLGGKMTGMILVDPAIVTWKKSHNCSWVFISQSLGWFPLHVSVVTSLQAMKH